MILRLLMVVVLFGLSVPAYAQDSSVQESLIETVHKSEEAKKQPITPSELKAKIREATKERQKAKAAPKKAAMTAKPKSIPAAKRPTPIVDTPVTSTPSAPAVPDMQISKDVSYGDDPAQVMDIYAPYGSGSAPVVVLLQASTWLKDDKQAEVSRAKIAHWTNKGFIVVILRTRMAPAFDLAQSAEDISRAVFYLKDNLKRYGGDPDHIGVIGYDMGAHVLMLATSDASINRGVIWSGSVVLDAPAFDVTSLMRGRPIQMQKDVFGEDAPENWVRLSPYSQVKGPVTPILLICPSQIRDGCAQAEKYQTKSKRMGNVVQIMPVEKDHSQIYNDLGSAGDYTDQVDAFLKTIGVAP